jgi:hypothetical protein
MMVDDYPNDHPWWLLAWLILAVLSALLLSALDCT